MSFKAKRNGKGHSEQRKAGAYFIDRKILRNQMRSLYGNKGVGQAWYAFMSSGMTSMAMSAELRQEQQLQHNARTRSRGKIRAPKRIQSIIKTAKVR